MSDSIGMKTVTKKEIADRFISSFTAALSIALESGEPLDIPGIASAAANNAAFSITLEVHDRGVEDPYL